MLSYKDIRVIPKFAQDGYQAKFLLECETKVWLDMFGPEDRKAPPSDALQMRFDKGNAYELHLNEIIRKSHRQARGTEKAFKLSDIKFPRTLAGKKEGEKKTLNAMKRGSHVILNGRLRAPGLIGEPDILIREDWSDDAPKPYRFVPLDAKWHRVNEGSAAARPWLVSTINDLAKASAIERQMVGTPNKKDSLQLVHYRLMLDYHGHASEGPWGGVIGRDTDEDGNILVLWHDTEAPLYKHGTLSANDLYRQAHIGLTDMVVAERARGPLDDVLVTPERISACGECHWQNVCSDTLEEERHVTLLPGLTARRAVPHYEAGVTTVPQLARLDTETAYALQQSDKLDQVVYSGADDEASLSDYLPPSHTRRLSGMGLTRAGQINSLHAPTLRYAGSKTPRLVEQIDQARVELADRVHRRRGVESVSIPRAAVELDVDIEDNNVGDESGICYMIGTLLRVKRRNGTVLEQYIPFYTWDNTPEAEAECFARFYAFVDYLRNWARSSGTGGFKSYFYSNHETRYFRHLVKKHEGWTGEGSIPDQRGEWQDATEVAVPTSDELEAFFDSGDWVDMRPILEGDLMWPTRSHGLKDLAKYVKFMWRDNTPGGGNSVAWYAEAIDETHANAEVSRQRLLDYNEDDVRATLALRDFLTRLGEARRPGAKLPSVEDLEVRYNPRY